MKKMSILAPSPFSTMFTTLRVVSVITTLKKKKSVSRENTAKKIISILS